MIARFWLPPLVTLVITLAPMPFLDARYELFPDPMRYAFMVAIPALVIGSVVVRSTAIARALIGACVALALFGNIVGFCRLFGVIFAAGSSLRGESLLLSAAECWIANVAAFALVYWFANEVLRPGGAEPGLLFAEGPAEPGQHGITDYLFVAATAALAFGPTDTPPANTAMRLAMLTEALIAFIIIVVVVARASNALG